MGWDFGGYYTDQLSTMFNRQPRAPKERDWSNDPYWDWRKGKVGQGTQQSRDANNAAYQLLQKYISREPGYSAEEKQAMYDLPAEQQKLQETAGLRTLNRTSAATGAFGSGGAQGGRAALIEGGVRTRANLKQNVMVQAAQAALEDRIRQIQAAEDFANAGMGMTRGSIESRNSWMMGQSAFDMQKWKTNLDQYNYNAQNQEQRNQMILRAILSMYGGGGGGMGMGMMG